jgi:biopolymer transport protein ExbD
VDLRILCGHCGQEMSITPELAGRQVACPKCGGISVAPGPSPASVTEKQSQVPVPKAPSPAPQAAKSRSVPPSQKTAPARSAEIERQYAPGPPPPPEEDVWENAAPFSFGGWADDDEEEDDMDMTPMVDVTFLLLIFFMITAAFTMQKSLESPAPDREESSAQARTIEEVEQDDDFIIVHIMKDDTVWIDDLEASSEQDLLVKLRNAKAETGDDGFGPRSLLVLADEECSHAAVVMALDVGNAVGMENVRLATVDEADF